MTRALEKIRAYLLSKLLNLELKDIEFLKKLGAEMATQDRRSTSAPYGLVILKENYTVTESGYGDSWYLLCDGGILARNFTDTVKYLMDNHKDDPEFLGELKKLDDDEELRELLEKDSIGREYYYLPLKKEWQVDLNNFCFTLLDSEAKQMEKRYCDEFKDRKSYGVYLGRSPSMKALYQILVKIGGKR